MRSIAATSHSAEAARPQNSTTAWVQNSQGKTTIRKANGIGGHWELALKRCDFSGKYSVMDQLRRLGLTTNKTAHRLHRLSASRISQFRRQFERFGAVYQGDERPVEEPVLAARLTGIIAIRRDELPANRPMSIQNGQGISEVGRHRWGTSFAGAKCQTVDGRRRITLWIAGRCE